jgi:antitoxin PrlF
METAMESALTAKCQATIPRGVREHLGLKPGDRLKFFIHPDGHVVLLPKLPASALRGMVEYKGPPVGVAEMDEAIAEGVMERYRRSSE